MALLYIDGFDWIVNNSLTDNYQGRWGDQKQLDRFLQSYAVEKTRLVARQKGHSVLEQPQQDGSIKLTIQVGGVA